LALAFVDEGWTEISASLDAYFTPDLGVLSDLLEPIESSRW
jgi:hypothetical protein